MNCRRLIVVSLPASAVQGGRAESGHAAAAPLSSAIYSRRLNRSKAFGPPTRRGRIGGYQIGVGQSAGVPTISQPVSCLPIRAESAVECAPGAGQVEVSDLTG
jgi:hypothetical protein